MIVGRVIGLFNTLLLISGWLLTELFVFVLAGYRVLRPRRVTNTSKTMNLLAYCLPPDVNSGTYRPLSFIKYAGENGWKVQVMSNRENVSPTTAGLELERQIPADTEVLRFNSKLANTSWQFTPALDGGLNNALSMFWQALFSKQSNTASVLVCSSPPFYISVAGLWLSKITGVPLVLDYRDEWTLCPFDFVSKSGIDKWYEKRCIQQASLVIYTTESHRVAHEQAFNIMPDRQRVIKNGWDSVSVDKVAERLEVKGDDITISYLGKLSGHVDVVPFLEMLEKSVKASSVLNGRVIVNFVGSKNKHIEKQLIAFTSPHITVRSIAAVPKSEAEDFMLQSSLLLMLCNDKLAGYIPGKLYDYLSTRVPIIAYGEPGEVSQILEHTNGGWFVESLDAKKMSWVLENHNDSRLDSNVLLTRWLDKHHRKSIAKDFYEVLNTLN